jgi:hypothetical protein
VLFNTLQGIDFRPSIWGLISTCITNRQARLHISTVRYVIFCVKAARLRHKHKETFCTSNIQESISTKEGWSKRAICRGHLVCLCVETYGKTLNWRIETLLNLRVRDCTCKSVGVLHWTVSTCRCTCYTVGAMHWTLSTCRCTCYTVGVLHWTLSTCRCTCYTVGALHWTLSTCMCSCYTVGVLHWTLSTCSCTALNAVYLHVHLLYCGCTALNAVYLQLHCTERCLPACAVAILWVHCTERCLPAGALAILWVHCTERCLAAGALAILWVYYTERCLPAGALHAISRRFSLDFSCHTILTHVFFHIRHSYAIFISTYIFMFKVSVALVKLVNAWLYRLYMTSSTTKRIFGLPVSCLKFKDQNKQKCDFTCYFIWVWNFVSHPK